MQAGESALFSGFTGRKAVYTKKSVTEYIIEYKIAIIVPAIMKDFITFLFFIFFYCTSEISLFQSDDF